MTGLWIALGSDEAAERIAAEAGTREPTGGLYWQLRRFAGEAPAQWVRIHQPLGGPLARRRRPVSGPHRGRRQAARVDLGDAQQR